LFRQRGCSQCVADPAATNLNKFLDPVHSISSPSARVLNQGSDAQPLPVLAKPGAFFQHASALRIPCAQAPLLFPWHPFRLWPVNAIVRHPAVSMALTGRDSCAFHFQPEFDQAADRLGPARRLFLFFDPAIDFCQGPGLQRQVNRRWIRRRATAASFFCTEN
jgi:hypothetical protein